MRRAASTLACAVALAVSGCDSTGPSPTPYLSFTYSGVASGTFSVQGALTEQSTSGVTGGTDQGASVVMAVMADGATGILAFVLFPTASTGTLALQTEAQCDEGGPSMCVGVALMLTLGTGAEPTIALCTLTSGSVTVTKSTTEEAAGTFSGTGTCVDFADTDLGTITLTDGAFLVRHSADPPFTFG